MNSYRELTLLKIHVVYIGELTLHKQKLFVHYHLILKACHITTYTCI